MRARRRDDRDAEALEWACVLREGWRRVRGDVLSRGVREGRPSPRARGRREDGWPLVVGLLVDRRRTRERRLGDSLGRVVVERRRRVGFLVRDVRHGEGRRVPRARVVQRRRRRGELRRLRRAGRSKGQIARCGGSERRCTDGAGAFPHERCAMRASSVGRRRLERPSRSRTFSSLSFPRLAAAPIPTLPAWSSLIVRAKLPPRARPRKQPLHLGVPLRLVRVAERRKHVDEVWGMRARRWWANGEGDKGCVLDRAAWVGGVEGRRRVRGRNLAKEVGVRGRVNGFSGARKGQRWSARRGTRTTKHNWRCESTVCARKSTHRTRPGPRPKAHTPTLPPPARAARPTRVRPPTRAPHPRRNGRDGRRAGAAAAPARGSRRLACAGAQTGPSRPVARARTDRARVGPRRGGRRAGWRAGGRERV